MTLPSMRKLYPAVRDWFTEKRGCRFAFVRGDGHMEMNVGVLKPDDEEDESRWLDVLAYELTPFASQYVVHIAQAAPPYQPEGWPALLAKEVEVRQFDRKFKKVSVSMKAVVEGETRAAYDEYKSKEQGSQKLNPLADKLKALAEKNADKKA